jgi:putative phosphotransacetylase
MVFNEVVARVSPEYATYMHVDYDEINAAMLSPPNIYGVIVD